MVTIIVILVTFFLILLFLFVVVFPLFFIILSFIPNQSSFNFSFLFISFFPFSVFQFDYLISFPLTEGAYTDPLYTKGGKQYGSRISWEKVASTWSKGISFFKMYTDSWTPLFLSILWTVGIFYVHKYIDGI